MNRLTPYTNTTSRDADLCHHALWSAWLSGLDNIQWYCVTALVDAPLLHQWYHP